MNWDIASENIITRLRRRTCTRRIMSGPRLTYLAKVRVLAIEAALRAGTPLRELGVEVTGLPAYWMDVVRLFELYRQKKRGEVLDVALVHAMHPTIAYLAYRYFGMES